VIVSGAMHPPIEGISGAEGTVGKPEEVFVASAE